MKRFLRDCKILTPELIQTAKMLLILNGVFLLLYWGIYLPNSDDFLLNPLLMCIPFNISMVLGFIYRYFSEWRKEIQEAFDKLNRQDKYPFFIKRFYN